MPVPIRPRCLVLLAAALLLALPAQPVRAQQDDAPPDRDRQERVEQRMNERLDARRQQMRQRREAEMRKRVQERRQELQAQIRREAAPPAADGVAKQDSLALVALYNATDGDNWSQNDGWLEEPVADWIGVTVSGDHIIALALNSNNLIGQIPVELAQLQNLLGLNLGNGFIYFGEGNQLTGSIPPELGQLTDLQVLDLSGNQLTENIPPELGQLRSLINLELFANNLAGEIPPELGKLENLQVLRLLGNQLAGEIPPELGQLQDLLDLWLTSNRISGKIPSELGQLQNLQFLGLSENELSGDVPPELGQLQHLESLSLGGAENQLNIASFLKYLSNLNKLRALSIHESELSGSFPSDIFALDRLRVINISDNELAGAIPAELGKLDSLRTLNMGGNQFTGSIPAELGQLSKLKDLRLSNNQLTGAIPTELSQLQNLVDLHLNNNQLIGAIPVSFTNLTVMSDILFGSSFYFNETDLCEPLDEDFQAWLDSIDDVQSTGVTCSSSSGPTITSVSPNPVTGSGDDQPLTVRGNGFDEGAFVILDDLDDNDPPFDDPSKTSFVSSTELVRQATFTESAATWSARVENPDGSQSEPFEFEVVAPGNGTASIAGHVYDASGSPIEDAQVAVTVGPSRKAITRADGTYGMSALPAGRGYEVQASAPGYEPQRIASVVLREGETTGGVDFALAEGAAGPYAVEPLSFDPNPDVSGVPVGGTAHRHYVVNDPDTGQPVAGVPVHVEELPNKVFRSDQNGHVQVSVPAEAVEDGTAGSSDTFTIYRAGEQSLVGGPMPFEVIVRLRVYTKAWKSSRYGELGVSFINAEYERGAKVHLDVVTNGVDAPNPEYLRINRQGRLGGGVSFGVSTPLKVEMNRVNSIDAGVGAGADVGATLSGVTEDRYRFQYRRSLAPEVAVAQYVLFASGNDYGELGQAYLQLLALCTDWLANRNVLNDAYRSDSKGISITGYAGAEADLVSPTPLPLFGTGLAGLSLEADIEASAELTLTNQRQSNRVDAAVSATGEAGTGGLIFAQSYAPGFVNKLDLSAGASARGILGAELKSSFTSGSLSSVYFSFLRGYDLSASATIGNGSGSVGADRETLTTYTFEQENIRTLVADASALGQKITGASSTNDRFSLDRSSFDRFLSNTMSALSDYQQQRSNPSYAVGYSDQETRKTPIDGVEVSVEVGPEAGLLDLSIAMGRGVNFVESYIYESERGKLYDWEHYPLVTNTRPDRVDLTYDAIVQNIVDQIPLSLRAALTTYVYITPPFSKSPSVVTFELADNGANLELEEGALPASVDTLGCHTWSWWGGSADEHSSAGKRQSRRYRIFNQIKERAQAEENLDYGIGGFYQFEPYNMVLQESSPLTLVYADADINGFNESELAIYREDKKNGRWIYMGGSVDPDANTVSTSIDTLGTFTLAPKAPAGMIQLTPGSTSIPADSNATTTITSEVIANNDGTPVSDGTLITVTTTGYGAIVTSDADASAKGVQVAAQNGRISFEVMSGTLPVKATILARSVAGTARGNAQVSFTDDQPPSAPALEYGGLSEDGKVILTWTHEESADLSGFKVYFDGDGSGAPYEGEATIVGSNSPIDVGRVDSFQVAGLDADSTFRFAVTAYDIADNESDYSNELSVDVTGTGSSETVELPDDFYLEENYPNPFNPVTTIEFGLPEPAIVRLTVYNVLGQRIKTLLDERRTAGQHHVQWNGTNESGVGVASGVYFYVLRYKDHVTAKKMVLVK